MAAATSFPDIILADIFPPVFQPAVYLKISSKTASGQLLFYSAEGQYKSPASKKINLLTDFLAGV